MQELLEKYAGKVRRSLQHELGGLVDASDLEATLNRAAYEGVMTESCG